MGRCGCYLRREEVQIVLIHSWPGCLIPQSQIWLQGRRTGGTGRSAEWKTSSTCWLRLWPEAAAQHTAPHVCWIVKVLSCPGETGRSSTSVSPRFIIRLNTTGSADTGRTFTQPQGRLSITLSASATEGKTLEFLFFPLFLMCFCVFRWKKSRVMLREKILNVLWELSVWKAASAEFFSFTPPGSLDGGIKRGQWLNKTNSERQKNCEGLRIDHNAKVLSKTLWEKKSESRKTVLKLLYKQH